MRFERLGLQFDYPENWVVDTGDGGDRLAAVTLSTPEGGFWSVSAHAPGGDPDQLATAVVRQMQHEYQDLDIARATETLAGHALEGYDFNFYCLDLTNTAMVRTVSTTNSIHLIFCQAEDREWERVEPIFAAITASLVRRLAPP